MPLVPPQKHEVLPACRVFLELNAYDFGQVAITEGNVLQMDSPDPGPDGSWRRVVLMPVINGIADPQEHPDKVSGFRFRVRCDFNPPQLGEGVTYADIGLNLQAVLEGQHQKVYEVLNEKLVTLEKAVQVYRIIRYTKPGPMFRDENKGYRYMMSEYITIIGPVPRT
jgi:hypothetical protein